MEFYGNPKKMPFKYVKRILLRYNNFILHDIDTAPENCVFPKSLLDWKSTKELDYLKFLVNKKMSITNVGIDKMLGEL